MKIFENFRKFKRNSRISARKTLKCQYLPMNRHLYLYYLCSNYLTTATNHRPNWEECTTPLLKGGARLPVLPPLVTVLYSHTLLGGPTFYWGARPPRPPSWLRPCFRVLNTNTDTRVSGCVLYSCKNQFSALNR